MNCTGCGVKLVFWYTCKLINGEFCDRCIDDIAHCDEHDTGCCAAFLFFKEEDKNDDRPPA